MHLSPEVKRELLATIRSFFKESLDEEIGDLKAALVLDFALAQIGPAVYNQALADADAFLRARLEDMEPSLGKPLPSPSAKRG